MDTLAAFTPPTSTLTSEGLLPKPVPRTVTVIPLSWGEEGGERWSIFSTFSGQGVWARPGF